MPNPLTTIGDYLIIGELGAGGMGVVYEARHLQLNRRVALKIIRPEFASQPDARRRFRIEAEAIAALAHPHIVPVYDVGEDGDQMYLAMGLVAGGSLAESIASGPLPLDRVIEWAITLAGAVDHAHQRGVLHRDLKPANVLLDAAGEPHLADFGLAKLVESAGQASLSQGFLGTPAYLAPEVAGEGTKAATTASDVYALGVVLFEMLTGRLPFPPGSALEILESVKTCRIPPPRTLRPDIPADLELICLKCLRREPTQRYLTAGEFGRDLERFRRNDPITARQPSMTELLWVWARRNRTVAILAVALPIALATGLEMALVQRNRAEAALKDVTAALAVEESRTARGLFESHPELALQKLANAERSAPHDRLLAATFLELLTRQNFLIPVTVPLRHEAAIVKTRFSSDANWLAVASEDGNARVWNVQTGQPASPPLKHGAHPISLEFDRLGKRLLSLSRDGIGRVWDLPGGSCILTTASLPRITDARFLPSGREVVHTATDGVVRIQETETGMIRLMLPSQGQFPGTESGNRSLPIAVSFDGSWVATGGSEVRLWSTANGSLIKTLRRDGMFSSPQEETSARLWSNVGSTNTARPVGSEFRSLVISPSQEFVAAVTGFQKPPVHSRVWLADETKIDEYRDKHSSLQDALESATAGAKLSLTGKGRVIVWNLHSGECLPISTVHQDDILHLQFNPLGDRLAAVSTVGTASVASLQSNSVGCITAQLRQPVVSAVVDFAAATVIAGCTDGTVRYVDVDTGVDLAAPVPFSSRVTDIELCPDSTRVAIGMASGLVAIVGLRTGEAASIESVGVPGVRHTVFAPSGDQLYAACDDGTLRLVEGGSGHEVSRITAHNGEVTALRLDASGRMILSASTDGTAGMWSSTTRTDQAPTVRLDQRVLSLRMTSDNRHLATLASDGNLHIWQVVPQPGPRPLQKTLAGVMKSDEAYRFLPDNRTVIAGMSDGRLVRWHFESGESPVAITPSSSRSASGLWVGACDVSPDGRFFAAGWSTGHVLVYTTEEGLTVGAPRWHRSEITCVAFSADGAVLATGSADRTIRLWDTLSGEMLGAPLEHLDVLRAMEFDAYGGRLLTRSHSGDLHLWDMRTGTEAGWRFNARSISLLPLWPHVLTDGVQEARFSPDGQRIAIVRFGGHLTLLDVPAPNEPVPAWVPLLAEALAFRSSVSSGSVQQISELELFQILQELRELRGSDVYSKWGRWFAADRSSRPVSPFATLSVPAFVTQAATQANVGVLRMALLMDPTNALLRARVITTDTNSLLQKAKRLSKRALEQLGE